MQLSNNNKNCLEDKTKIKNISCHLWADMFVCQLTSTDTTDNIGDYLLSAIECLYSKLMFSICKYRTLFATSWEMKQGGTMVRCLAL